MAGDFNGDGRLDLAVANALIGSTVSRAAGQRRRHVPARGQLRRGDGPMPSWRATSTATASSTWPSPTWRSNDRLGAAGQRRRHVPARGHLRSRDRPLCHRGGRLQRRRPARPGRRRLRGVDDGPSGVILLGNGDGTFQPAVNVRQWESSPVAIVAGDFNGDGQLDLAVANAPDNVQSRAAGQRRRHVPAPGAHYAVGQSVPSGDRGRRLQRRRPARPGRRQLCIRRARLVLLGNGDGTFQPQVTYAAGQYPDAHRGGGLQRRRPARPGRRCNAIHPTTCSVLLGNGDGTFQPQVTYAVGTVPIRIVAGDFNGDGRLDLAVVELIGANDVSVLLGNGDGTFQPQRHITRRDRTPVAIVAGDFNGDGRLDLAVADPASNSGNDHACRCCWATATARSSPGHLRGRDRIRTSIVAGDFNGDGRLDLAVASLATTRRRRCRCLLGNGDGTFQPAGHLRGGIGSCVDRGGRLQRRRPARPGRRQTSMTPAHGARVSVLLGNGDGTFQPAVTVRGGIGTSSGIVAGDFNGDGHLDLAVDGSYIADYVEHTPVLLGNGDGTFQPQVTYRGRGWPDGHRGGRLQRRRPARPGRRRRHRPTTCRCCWATATARSPTPASSPPTPHATPLVADVNGDGTDDVLVVDGAGDILYRQGIPGQPGTFCRPSRSTPASPRRDIAWVPEHRSRPGPRQRRRPGQRHLVLRLPRRRFRPADRLARHRPAAGADHRGRPQRRRLRPTWSSAMPAMARCRSSSAPRSAASVRRSRELARSAELPAGP